MYKYCIWLNYGDEKAIYVELNVRFTRIFFFFNLMACNLNYNILNYTINTLKRQLVLKSLIIFSSDKSIKKKLLLQ